MRISDWSSDVCSSDLAAVYLAFTRRSRAALLLFTVFGGRLLVELMKVIVDRDRPGVDQHLEAVHSVSFPSGHAANAMITYVAIALLVPVRQRNRAIAVGLGRSEEHTSELQSLMRISYAVFCSHKKTHVKRIDHMSTEPTQRH